MIWEKLSTLKNLAEKKSKMIPVITKIFYNNTISEVKFREKTISDLRHYVKSRNNLDNYYRPSEYDEETTEEDDDEETT